VLFIVADGVLLFIGIGAYVLFQRRRRVGNSDAVAVRSPSPPARSSGSAKDVDGSGTGSAPATTNTTEKPDHDIRAHT
jgi:hypothetical protein